MSVYETCFDSKKVNFTETLCILDIDMMYYVALHNLVEQAKHALHGPSRKVCHPSA